MSIAAQGPAPQPAPPAPPYPAAVTISGPPWHSPLAHGGAVPLIHPQIHIGILETNDIVLTDPGASRVHAVIEWTPQGYAIRDLESRSGTFVQERAISGPTLLTPGQHLRIGGTDLSFQAIQLQGAVAGWAPPAAPGAAASQFTVLPMQAISNAVQQAQVSGFQRWRARQRPKLWWRIFLAGLAIYIVTWLLLLLDGNLHAVPLVALSASAVVPVTFVTYCWEQGAFADMPPTIVGLAFVSGATLGLIAAGTLEDIFVGGSSVLTWFLVGLIEETAKALAVIWFLRNRRLGSELDGLVLGAATGMGFAALETAGYGFVAFFRGFLGASAAGFGKDAAVRLATVTMGIQLDLRMVLAVFGHGIWTAIICAAFWRERQGQTLRLTGGVALAFAISVLLHTIWDASASGNPLAALFGLIFVAVVGVLLFRFFLRESVARAKLAPGTPAPPLGPALAGYFGDLFARHQRPVAQAQLFVSPGMTSAVNPLCGGCGATLPPGGKFCGMCGHPVAGS